MKRGPSLKNQGTMLVAVCLLLSASLHFSFAEEGDSQADPSTSTTDAATGESTSPPTTTTTTTTTTTPAPTTTPPPTTTTPAPTTTPPPTTTTPAPTTTTTTPTTTTTTPTTTTPPTTPSPDNTSSTTMPPTDSTPKPTQTPTTPTVPTTKSPVTSNTGATGGSSSGATDTTTTSQPTSSSSSSSSSSTPQPTTQAPASSSDAQETTTTTSTQSTATAAPTDKKPTSAPESSTSTPQPSTSQPSTSQPSTSKPSSATPSTAQPSTDEPSEPTATSPSTTSTTTTTPAPTAAPTTTPAPSKYPTKKPDKPFQLSFPVGQNANDSSAVYCADVNCTYDDIADDVKGAFQTMEGYLYVKKGDSASQRRKRDTRFHVVVVFDPNVLSAMNDSQRQGEVSQAVTRLGKTAGLRVDEQKANESIVSTFVQFDQCETGACPSGYSCRHNLCYHLCENYDCGANGVCNTIINPDGTSRATCVCNSDDDYTYSGDRCQTEEMSKAKVAAIVGGVLGTLCGLFLIVIVCLCCRMRGDSEGSRGKYQLGGYSNNGYADQEFAMKNVGSDMP